MSTVTSQEPLSQDSSSLIEIEESFFVEETPTADPADQSAEPEEDGHPSYHRFDHDTLEALEWSRITEMLASFCRTEWGRSYAKRLPFFATREEAERELRQVSEALQLLQEQGEHLPVTGLTDLRWALQRVAKGGILDPAALLGIMDLLDGSAQLRNFVASHETRLPSLWEKAELLKPLARLRRDIGSVLDRSGRLRDDASWELSALREEVRRCHDRIRRQMQEYLSSHSRHLTDNYYTLRQDRYVLPVRASDRGRIAGIVYGSSGSGATVFVEPQPVVALNNALRIAEEDVLQEELRILRKLCDQVKQDLPALSTNLELLRDFDVLQSRVLMAQHLDASVPALTSVNEQACIDLRQARHPLLIGKGISVIANDMILGPSNRTLLISGPNTGGKTVVLKTVGLCALMAQAGLPIPALPGSRMPFFDKIFTDIGDHQSIERDLSTFSAQIVKLREIMDQAHPQSLILIDEIVVGTDPHQGAALATAILEHLTDKHCFVVTTTHYEQLKALAYEDSRFLNASVGFDLQQLAPTYRLYLGTPGSSSALEIARRLGLAESLCGRAETLLSPAGDRFDRIIGKLEQQYQELYEERERATRARRKLEEELISQQRKSEQVEKIQDRLRDVEEQNWQRQYRAARELVKEAVRELQKESANWTQVQTTQQKLKQAETIVEQARETSQPVPSTPPPTQHQIRVGQKVKLMSLRTEGMVLEPPDLHGTVLVQAGIMRTRVPVKELRILSQPLSRTLSSSTSPPIHRPVSHASHPASSRLDKQTHRDTSSSLFDPTESFSVVPGPEYRCDLRGLRIEEAVDRAESFLAQSIQQERQAVILIHGHGTGALRDAIRDYCHRSPHIQEFRPGEPSEGGNGVTAVLLH